VDSLLAIVINGDFMPAQQGLENRSSRARRGFTIVLWAFQVMKQRNRVSVDDGAVDPGRVKPGLA
jgi:hypothetical protein